MDDREFGHMGETRALSYLQERGWILLGRNVRVGHRELDLIVRRGHVLAFVEVKTRRGLAFGSPLEAITPAKRRDVCRAAAQWLRENDCPPGITVRFDAMGVLKPRNGPIRITHIPDAWCM
jgi:putative endonuclease